MAGIIFLGAPFQGSGVAIFGELLARLSGLDSTLLEMLRKGSPDLYAMSTDFYSSYSDRDLVCFYEKKEVSYFGVLEKKVNLYSSLQTYLTNKSSIGCHLAIIQSAWKAEHTP